MFRSVFDQSDVLGVARRLGAVERVRKQHPADVVAALVECALGDEERSIATARRAFARQTGFTPEESSFYDRLTPGMAKLGWLLFLKIVARCNRVQRRRLAEVIGLQLRDVRAIDATRATLPAAAAAHLPSTDSRLGGFKLTVALSLLEDLVVQAKLTDARQHDRKALGELGDVADVLHLMDRGYCDHRLFADIADGGGYFLIRLKDSSVPTVRAIRRGLGKAHIGEPLDGALPYRGTVDVDCAFRVGGQVRIFRVVSVVTDDGTRVWLATNLPVTVAAEAIATLYRLRWGIENLFRVMKTVGRLDQLKVGNPTIVRIFVVATLIGIALAHGICAAMRAERPHVEPSLHRVFALVLARLPLIVAAMHSRDYLREIDTLITALWREGVNPNPGRPYARERHLATVGK